MISPVVTISEAMKEKKRIKMKIRVGFLVKAKVGNIGGEYKGGKKQEDEERCGEVCPVFGGE